MSDRGREENFRGTRTEGVAVRATHGRFRNGGAGEMVAQGRSPWPVKNGADEWLSRA